MIRAVDGDDVQHVPGALVGAATVATRRLRSAPGESGIGTVPMPNPTMPPQRTDVAAGSSQHQLTSAAPGA